MSAPRLPRPRYEVCDWEEYRRPRHALVRRVWYRRADNGNPVEVLRPTLRGRVVMFWRAWTQA